MDRGAHHDAELFASAEVPSFLGRLRVSRGIRNLEPARLWVSIRPLANDRRWSGKLRRELERDDAGLEQGYRLAQVLA